MENSGLTRKLRQVKLQTAFYPENKNNGHPSGMFLVTCFLKLSEFKVGIFLGFLLAKTLSPFKLASTI